MEINFSTDEGALRRSLFENTGGSFPELITRGDIKLFLPRTYIRNESQGNTPLVFIL